MAAVNHDPGDEIGCIVLFLAEGAVVLVQKFVDKFIDLVT